MKKQRWRITFAKTEAMRFTGHLDLILTWERSFRRSGIPLSYSEGFNPHPVINLAAPLPLGFTSKAEIGDFWLSAIVPKNEFEPPLKSALPPGLTISEVEEIPTLHGNKLPTLVQAAVYQITLEKTYQGLPDRLARVLAAKSLIRERRNKTYDLRPLIQSLSLMSPATLENTIIETTLSLLPGATGRPEEVLTAIDINPLETSICRVEILLKSGSPMP